MICLPKSYTRVWYSINFVIITQFTKILPHILDVKYTPHNNFPHIFVHLQDFPSMSSWWVVLSDCKMFVNMVPCHWITHLWPKWSVTRLVLAHWGPDDMTAISQTTFSNAFFLNENAWISLQISLKFVPKVWINNIPELVQIMTWRRPGTKPLSWTNDARLWTHICVTRPQLVNPLATTEFWRWRFQIIFWWKKIIAFSFKFYCRLIPMVHLRVSQLWLR